MIHKHLLICKLPCVSFASLWSVRAYHGPFLVSSFSVFSCAFCFPSLPVFLNFVCCQIYREHESWHHSFPWLKFKISIQKCLNLEGWTRGDLVLNIPENARSIEKYIGTIHMVQNTNMLLYRSTITFSYQFYITQHPYCLQNIFYYWIAFTYLHLVQESQRFKLN